MMRSTIHKVQKGLVMRNDQYYL